MEKIRYCYIYIFLLFITASANIWGQNNVPMSEQVSRPEIKKRERPERALVKRKPIHAKHFRTTGKWIDFAVAYDEENKGLSISNPVEIRTAEQLAYLAKRVNDGENYAGRHFTLMADINLHGRQWTPIGLFGEDYDDNSKRFCGLFHGNGHKIEHLIITDGEDYIGLFGVCGAKSYIEKLHIAHCYIRGKMIVGGLIGEQIGGSVSECSVSGTVIGNGECAGGMVGINNGTIINSQSSADVFGNSGNTGGLAGVSGETMPAVIDNCKATGHVTGYWNVGGLVGRNNSLISNSQASGNVDGDEWVGGLVGWQDAGMVNLCHASGTVKGFFDVGGLVGFNGYLRSTVQIANSYATGKVSGVSSGNFCIGGLAGHSGGIITDCYATGNVKGEESVGGLLGENMGRTVNSYSKGNIHGYCDCGGLVGFNGYAGSISYLENCYSTGNVHGFSTNNYSLGGLIGFSGGTVVRCHSSGSVTGTEIIGGLIGDQSGTVTDCYATGNIHATKGAGGLVGWNTAKISNSFATGHINSHGTAVGGLIGQNAKDGVVENTYYDRETTKKNNGFGQNKNEDSSVKITPLSTVELKNGSFPEGFDTAVWEVRAGQYPGLKSYYSRR